MASDQSPSPRPAPRGWNDEDDEAQGSAFKPLTREEAQALRAAQPPVSPWRVVLAQVVIGAVVALLAALVTGRLEVAWSALYGAATAVVPGALMARGMTSRLTSLSPAASAVSVMLWELVKIAVSVAMLLLAPQLVRPLSWPALLAGLVAGLSMYWFALLWRGRKERNGSSERDGSTSKRAHRQ